MKNHIIAAFVLSFGVVPMMNAQVESKKPSTTTQKDVVNVPTISAEDRAQNYTQQMKQELNLTQMQEQKIYELSLGVEWKNDAIRENQDYSAEKKQQFIQANLDQKKMVMSQMLDEEQNSKLSKMESASTPRTSTGKDAAPTDAKKASLEKSDLKAGGLK